MDNFREISPLDVQGNFIRAIGEDWMLVTAGDRSACNTMTASWGGVGEMWNRHVAMVVIRPQRYTKEFVDRHQRLSLSFLPDDYRKALAYCGAHTGRDEDKIANAGLTVGYSDAGTPVIAEARLILECRKLYAAPYVEEGFLDGQFARDFYPGGDYHTLYVCEIEKAFVNR